MKKSYELTNVIEQNFGKGIVNKHSNLGEWLHAFGNASEALLYSILFLPELTEIGNSVLLSWGVSDEESKKRFLDAINEGSMSREDIEASFNFVEVGYLFDASGRDTSDAEDSLLAELIRNAWDGWIKLSYPNKNFKVEVLPAEVTGSTVGVHFFEIR